MHYVQCKFDALTSLCNVQLYIVFTMCWFINISINKSQSHSLPLSQIEERVIAVDGQLDIESLLDQVGHVLNNFKVTDEDDLWYCSWLGTNARFPCPDNWFKKVGGNFLSMKLYPSLLDDTSADSCIPECCLLLMLRSFLAS